MEESVGEREDREFALEIQKDAAVLARIGGRFEMFAP
jgi:hypothetical protein